MRGSRFWGAGAWLPLLLLALLAGCAGRGIRPERMDEGQLRAWIAANWEPLRGARLSWRGQYQDAEQEIPFRLELAYAPDSARLALCSPFGGELVVLRCARETLGARTGSSLGGWLGRAAAALEEGGAASLLDWGAARLAGLPEGLSVEVKDPALAPFLGLALEQLPDELRSEGLCSPEVAGPWLWGAWQPPAGADWHPGELEFRRGAERWSIHPGSGLVEAVETGGWVIRLEGFETRSAQVKLPSRMVLERPRERRRVVLQLRDAQLELATKE